MSALLCFLSKLMVTRRDSRLQQNLGFRLCAIITVASVSDFSFLVLTGSEKRPFDRPLTWYWVSLRAMNCFSQILLLCWLIKIYWWTSEVVWRLGKVTTNHSSTLMWETLLLCINQGLKYSGAWWVQKKKKMCACTRTQTCRNLPEPWLKMLIGPS